MSLVSLLLGNLTDFLFPRTAHEEAFFALSPAELLLRLPRAEPISAEASALFEYAHKEVKAMVWRVKYKGNWALTAKLGTLLADTLAAELEEAQLVEKYGPPLLIPAPISLERRLARGWNQAELLAAALVASASPGSLRYLPHGLKKTRHTESQTKASGRAKRLENLKGSMTASPEVAGRLCIFLDDVYTTGATFREAKRALAEANARKVICLTVAH